MRPRYLDRIGVDEGFLLVVSLLLGLAIGCELPVPPVPPGPSPQPPPIVITTDATLIVIEETADRTPETAAVLGDITFWSGLGVKWRIYDDDSPDAVVYLPLVKDRPGLIVFDKTGKILWGGALPKTTDDVRKLVR